MDELGIDVSALGDKAEALRAQGQTVMFVAIDRTIAGAASASRIRSKRARRKRSGPCAANGIRIVMVTGDSRNDGRRPSPADSASTK